MTFKGSTRRRAIVYEKALVTQWKTNKTFEKSIAQRPAENAYVFYDGPPFITGVPHHGTLLSSIAKDVVPRYWTMKGRRVERVWGWDCHGLPAEVFTEKKLGIKDRRDIGTKISLEEYILTCRENMVSTGSLWEDTIDRIGRWVDFKGAYRTMDKDYMESVWWAFKELYDKGKIYQGERVLLYCTRDATPLSKAEVTMDAGSYREVVDPSVYIKFKLIGDNAYLLAWTTTPWTLPANVAVAVNKTLDYSEVEVDGQRFILATELLDKALTDEKHTVLPYKILRSMKGEELVGKRVEPLFEDRGHNAHRVYHEDYVTVDEGTGVVHWAPDYGEEDFRVAKEHGIPLTHNIDDSGFYTEGEWKGKQVWETSKEIAKALHERGVVWKIEYYRHSYPHCYRCGTKLMYRAHPSWFMDIGSQRQAMLEQSEAINWFPGHLKHGRFAKTVETAPDWNLSRDRFWATAMPVWEGKDAEGRTLRKVVGSYAELKQLSGVELEDYHRPWVDDIEFDLDGVHYKRIDKVLDCWFESGSMPFAQFHYPFENVEKFEHHFPGDFIVEYVGQVRAWFYYVHAVGVGLKGVNSYKNVITTGTLSGSDGRKMSKSYGNYTDPNELMDLYSADALRFLLMSSPLMSGEDFVLKDKDVQDVQRKLAMIWNMYDFFTTYAEVDAWEWGETHDDPSEGLSNPLDIWVVSRLHQLQQHVTRHMDSYNIPEALADILPFLDDASNWFVRRSRRRFWKSGDDADKQAAYRTLHYVLVRLSTLMAPFTPFLAEELFQQLTDGKLGESVHLLDWPVTGEVDEKLLTQMQLVRGAVNEGLAIRAKNGIKVRQPLSAITLRGNSFDEDEQRNAYFAAMLTEELNVKAVHFAKGADGGASSGQSVSYLLDLDLSITPELKREGQMREVIRHVQAARKAAGLNVDDRIRLSLQTDNTELCQAIDEHQATIAAETLATEVVNQLDDEKYEATVSVDGQDLALSLQKAVQLAA